MFLSPEDQRAEEETVQKDVSRLLPCCKAPWCPPTHTHIHPEPGASGPRWREHTREGYVAPSPAACSELCRAWASDKPDNCF